MGRKLDRRRLVLVAAPPALLLTTHLAFTLPLGIAGARAAWLGGFLFYWLFWCLCVPFALLGPRAAFRLFGASARRSLGPGVLLALGAPLALAYGYAFPRALAEADARIVLLSLVLAAVNAPLEELLWRGTFLRLFPDSRLLGWFYPAVAFGLWHLVPQEIFPNRQPGGAASFVLVATLLGLAWGWAARRTGSIRATAIAHLLFDFAGLGGRLY